MKRKSLVKKALLPAIVAVVCSVLALTSVSYAWFTMGNSASVGTIDVNVKAADGIQISADAQNWKSVLPITELKGVATNQFPTNEILPMSSVGQYTDGKQLMYKGTVGSDGKTLVTEAQAEGASEKNFIAFDIYVKLDNEKEFYLSQGSSVVGVTNSQGIEESVRVSFAYLGTADTAAGAVALAPSSVNPFIWEPNHKNHSHVESGVDNGTAVESYYGVKKANSTGFDMTSTTDAENLAEVEPVQIDYGTDGKTTTDVKLFDLEAGYSKIRVYIWVEGQDADCINDASGFGFAVNLSFNVPEETE